MHQILKSNTAFLYFKNDEVLFYVSLKRILNEKDQESNLQINSPTEFVPELTIFT